MKVAFIVRSTLFTVVGGDTYQAVHTASQLRQLGTDVDIITANHPVDYNKYSLLHFFNLTRPADILLHITRTTVPFLVSPILIDYSSFDRSQRKGMAGLIFRHLPQNTIEYLKTIARRLNGTDPSMSATYLLKGQRRSVETVLRKCALLLPNSKLELAALLGQYNIPLPSSIVPNGVSHALFNPVEPTTKDPFLILCVARIEGIKNQLNLIRAVNNTPYRLLLIGSPAPNQLNYYRACRNAAAENVTFVDHLPQKTLACYYRQAKVHVLPSWFETCGLASLEAGAMNCNLVITDKGYTREYFGDHAFYCEPASPDSIHAAIDKAARAPHSGELSNKILKEYTWHRAAEITLNAYKRVLNLA